MKKYNRTKFLLFLKLAFMKTTLLLTALFLISIHSFSQINFEKGYFVNNDNQRIECLIKNNDWKNNPTEFEYKLTTTSDVERGTLSTVKEFGINGFSRYVKADTKIDISPSAIEHLSKDRNPEWLQQTLFLKVLVEGKAMLYYYEKSGLIRFFYSKPDSTMIDQLIYKEYYDTTKPYYVVNCEYTENKKFHDQLWTNVRCANTTTNVIEQLNYRKSDLIKYFIKFNDCYHITPVVYGKKAGKDSFHLKLCPGVTYSQISVSNTVDKKYNGTFKSQFNPRIGLEAELTLPFNMHKWNIIFEPTYQYYNSEMTLSTMIETINYKSIEFPIGIRYYFFLNQELKLFANAMFIPTYSFDLNSTFVYKSTTSSILPITYKLNSSQCYALGGGIGYKKFSAEMRYYTHIDLFNNLASWYSEYNRFSIILGFKIF
jgi:hypothetical protein